MLARCAVSEPALVKGPPAQGVLLGPLGLLSALPWERPPPLQGKEGPEERPSGAPLGILGGNTEEPQGWFCVPLQRQRRASHIDRCWTPGRFLHSFRRLRDFAAKGCWEAQVSWEPA